MRHRRHIGALGQAPGKQQGATASGASRPQQLSALLGGSVELECDLEPADENDSVSLVLWYKDESMVPIYR